MGLRDLFVFAIVCGILPFVFRRPHVGLLLFFWFGYMNIHRYGWGVAYSFPFAAVIGGVTILSFVFSDEQKKLPRDPVVWLLILWVAWASFTTFFALNPDQAFYQWNRFIKIQIMTILSFYLLNKPERIKWLVWVIVAGIGFYSVKGGLFTLVTAGQYRVWGPPDTFIEGNNEIGFATLVILPLMVFLRSQLTKTWQRHAMLLAIVLSCFTVAGTQSRGAFLAGAVLALFMILKSQRKALALLVVALLIPVVMAFMPETYTDRMETIKTYEEDASAMGRINAWWMAFNLANDRPVLGGGFDVFFLPQMFARYAPDPNNVRDVHSIYFEVLGEHGYPGLLLFLGLLAMTYRSCTMTIKKSRDNPDMKWVKSLSRMVQTSLVAFCVGGAFLGLAYFDLLYHLVVLAVLLRQVVGKQNVPVAENGHNRVSWAKNHQGAEINSVT